MKTVDKILQKHLINSIGKKNTHKITDNALFLEDLGMSSMLLISFFTNVIDDLKISIIEFSDTELTEIKSVLDLKTALYSKASK